MLEARGRGRAAPHAGSPGVDRSQGAAQRTEGGHREVRGDLPLRWTRPTENEVHEVPPQAYEHKALSRSHSLPCSFQNLLAHCSRYDSTQNEAWSCCTCTHEGFRRCASTVRQGEEDGIPDALKVLRLQAGHKYCLLGRLSSEVGWNHYDTIKELEAKRKERSQVVYERKKQLNKLRAKAEKVAEEKLGAQLEILAPVKY